MNASDLQRLLILETSGRRGTVALAAGSTLLTVRHLDETRRHARDLAPTVASLLAEQGWTPRDLAGVLVSLGPGSYTGLRVGIVSAKTLAYATGCALIGVSTFAAIAQQAPADITRLDVLADAQQDKIYVQPFVKTATGWLPSRELTIVSFASWLEERDAEAWVTGPGLHRWTTHITNGERVLERSYWDPQPESLLQVGLTRYLAGERDDVYTLEPLYLRPSAAEEQWKNRNPG